MSKKTFGNQYFFTHAVVFVPAFLAFRYFESIDVMDDFGVGNTIITALILSAIPAFIISMALRYFKK